MATNEKQEKAKSELLKHLAGQWDLQQSIEMLVEELENEEFDRGSVDLLLDDVMERCRDTADKIDFLYHEIIP